VASAVLDFFSQFLYALPDIREHLLRVFRLVPELPLPSPPPNHIVLYFLPFRET